MMQSMPIQLIAAQLIISFFSKLRLLKTKEYLSLLLVIGAAMGVPALVSKPAQAGPAIVFDPTTDIVVYSEDADKLWHPASITKIMTAYLTFEAVKSGKLKLEDKCKQSEILVIGRFGMATGKNGDGDP